MKFTLYNMASTLEFQDLLEVLKGLSKNKELDMDTSAELWQLYVIVCEARINDLPDFNQQEYATAIALPGKAVMMYKQRTGLSEKVARMKLASKQKAISLEKDRQRQQAQIGARRKFQGE